MPGPSHQSRLILLEGVPGSGRSSAAQAVARALAAAGRPARWWYEEEAGHPLSPVRGEAGEPAAVEDLGRGRLERATAAALERWAAFAAGVAGGDRTVVADGCLLGRLTCSLFRTGAGADRIHGYVRAVAHRLERCPALVLHLRVTDLEGSWRALFRDRGEAWERRAIERVAASPRGRRAGLAGFPGLLRYWREFRELADGLVEELPLPWRRVDVDAGDRAGAEAEVLRLLGLVPAAAGPPPEGWPGVYAGARGERVEVVRLAGGGLTVRGLPGAWPAVALLPAGWALELRGLPWRLRTAGAGFDVEGPPLRDAPVPGPYRRVDAPAGTEVGQGGPPAAGGGRWVEVAPERLPRWLADFDASHRVVRSSYSAATALFEAMDGAAAECHPPFPPLPEAPDVDGLAAEPLVAHARRQRAVGVLLVRLGGHAVGVFEGERLVASAVGSRPVHGRSAAGGRSQHRFARRREGQARRAAGAAADDAARVLVPRLAGLDAVVLGGERRAVDALRAEARLAGVFERAAERFLTTPDPGPAVLSGTPAAFRAVRVRLVGA